MNNKKRFISLKTKIMISTLVPVIVSFALISSVIFFSLNNSLHKTAEAQFLQISHKYAYNFENKINNAMNYLSILASELSVRVEAESTDRETLQKTILSVFDDYGLIDGSSVYFEANMYDGKDADYLGTEYGTETSGRICWYFYIDDGKTAYLPEGLADDIEFELPHYTKAKESNHPIYTDPVAYEIDGRDISMFTLTYPINDSSGNFIGAVTVDLFLDDIYTQLQNEKIYETGYVIIANDNDRVIYSPHYEDIGATREETGLDYALPSGEEESAFFNAKSILNGKNTLVTVNSIYISQLDSNFYISVSAPLDEINAEATRLTILLTLSNFLIVAAIAILLYYRIGKISAPLSEIPESINKIASGGYNTRITGAYKGEFAIIKDSVNTMADSIEAYMEESKNSLNILKNILNGLEAFIYVTVPDTGEILFMNDYMREHFNLADDCVGQICYTVIQKGLTEKCDFCPCHQLEKEPDKVVLWEDHNPITDRDYRNSDRYIEWIGGRKAHLQHAIDITDIKMAQSALDRRLRQQSLMAAISQSFLSDADIDTLITNALRMTGEFMGIVQILYYKLADDELTFTCQCEWINPEMDMRTCIGTKQVTTANLVSHMKSLAGKKDFCLNSNDPLLAEEMALYRVNFRNYITAPIYIKGNLYGALDFFTEDNSQEWGNSDTSLAALIASLLSGVLERHSMETELIKAKELAEQGSRSKSEFLSRMSHEMRTPMNAIIGMTSVAKGANDIERKDYCLDKIDTASTHLLGVINDVLDMSKIEAGRFELSYTDFSLEKMLIKITNVISYRIEEKKQRFTVRVDPDVPQAIVSDEQRLSQVITNLLSNAVKFTHEEGTISLFVRRAAEENGLFTLAFEVKDSGIGISKEQQGKLFRSFEQADGSVSRKYGGTGLGLAISKNIVELMGGEIWVESKVDEGASFIFHILVEKGQAASQDLVETNVNWSDLRILAVDDDEDVREYFLSMSGELKLQCEVAEGGAKACALMEKTGPYDIVFVDWKMPGMDGIELTKRIKHQYGENKVVIMISATEWSYIEAEAKQAGVDGFIPKPLFTSVIAECINECLGLREGTADDNTGRSEEGCFTGRRILLAEDVEINREIVAALLEPTGIRIDCAEDGNAAFLMFKDYPDYDMIFMDIHMPEVDGYESTRMIRALNDPRAQSVPIIAMTANVFREDIERCLEAGMNAHIGKPLDIEDVMENLRHYMLPDS